MENSNLSLVAFGNDLYFCYQKKGFSALELQRQMGHTRYATILELLHKLREVMGKRNDLYKLEDMAEYDEGFVEKATKASVKQDLKKGRGSQRQAIVATMAESTVLENIQTGEKNKS